MKLCDDQIRYPCSEPFHKYIRISKCVFRGSKPVLKCTELSLHLNINYPTLFNTKRKDKKMRACQHCQDCRPHEQLFELSVVDDRVVQLLSLHFFVVHCTSMLWLTVLWFAVLWFTVLWFTEVNHK